MKIDAHQHFWKVARGDYGWLTPDVGKIYRDFEPIDLQPALQSSGIDGTILVQAAPTVAETEYMLSLAGQHDFIKGVIGWVDFANDQAPAEIERLQETRMLVGLRPMIQDIPDTDWMLREELGGAFAALIDNDLVFDALVLPKHLNNLAALIARYDTLRVVIDHGAKPKIKQGEFADWAEDIQALARRENVYCKLSGLVTEVGENWSISSLRPYTDHLLNVFGSERLIWGSDWPVCTLAASYEEWCAATSHLLSGLHEEACAAVLGGNAERVYNLKGLQ